MTFDRESILTRLKKSLPGREGSDNFLLSVFDSMCIVLTTVVPLFAIVWCKGNSVMWLAVLLWLVYLCFLREKSSRKEMPHRVVRWGIIGTLATVVVGVFALAYYMFFVRTGGEYCGDFLFYSNASCVMMQEHVETAAFASLFHYPEPYHYGELWLTVLSSTLFGIKPLYALILITYPLFCFMLILGVAALCKELSGIQDLWALVLGVCFLFFVPLVSLIIPWMRTPIAAPKSLVILVFMMWGTLMLLKGNFPKAFVALCMLVPFYSTVAPGILTFVFLLSIALQWEKTHSWQCLWNRHAIVSLCLALLFGVFYLVQKKSPIEEPVQSLYDGNWIVNALSFTAKRSLRYLLLLLPTTLVLLYYTRKKSHKNTLWWIWGSLVVSILASGVIGGFMREISRDGGQITTNYVENMLSVVCFGAMVLVVFKVAGKPHCIPKWAFCFLFLLYPLFEGKASVADNNNYPVGDSGIEKDFLTRELIELKRKDVKFVEFKPLLDENGEINWHRAFSIMPHILRSGYYEPYNLSEIDLPENHFAVWDDSRRHGFWQYVYLQKQNETFISDEQSMLDFIKDMDIDYLIVSQGTSCPRIFRGITSFITSNNGDTLFRLNL